MIIIGFDENPKKNNPLLKKNNIIVNLQKENKKEIIQNNNFNQYMEDYEMKDIKENSPKKNLNSEKNSKETKK